MKHTYRGKVVARGNFRAVAKALSEAVGPKLDEIAEEGVDALRANYFDGRKPESDTGASADSFYQVTHDGKSNYAQAVEEMTGAGSVRYDKGKLQERVLRPLRIRSHRRHLRAAAATASKVVFYWNAGHHNIKTGRFEFVPLIDRTRKKMAGKGYARRFVGVLNGTRTVRLRYGKWRSIDQGSVTLGSGESDD